MINIPDLLYKNGVRNICISPGSRNTAISLLFIDYGKFNCNSIIDERSAAYFALGISLKTNTPTVLICTSGTATANYLPAVIEASQSKIPLIIITADRPTHLINSGENQTINQKNIYSDFIRKSLDFSEYDDLTKGVEDSLKFINSKYNHIVTGPIHFNIHLDKFENSNSKIKHHNISNQLFKNTKKYQSTFDWTDLPYKDIINIYNYQKPLIIVGRLNSKINLKLIIKLSKHLKAPILADPLSQIRFNNQETLNLYDHYINQDNINPDLIIRIGQKPISKLLCKKIDDWRNKKLDSLKFSCLLIDESGRFNDDSPTVVKTDYKKFINFIIKNTKENKNREFYDYILKLDNQVASLIKTEKKWSELTIAKSCLSSVNDNENFIIGNSMPIRYIEMLGNLGYNQNIHTYSNRGASGIDGVIATALGVSLSSNNKTTLLIGDLSFIYDQSSLLIAKQLKINLIIVIINNNGGGIFSLLPASNTINKKTFNKYWTTSHNLELKTIADLYDCNYKKVTTIEQLDSTLNNYHNIEGINIIDAQTNIQKNKAILANIKTRIKKGIV